MTNEFSKISALENRARNTPSVKSFTDALKQSAVTSDSETPEEKFKKQAFLRVANFASKNDTIDPEDVNKLYDSYAGADGMMSGAELFELEQIFALGNSEEGMTTARANDRPSISKSDFFLNFLSANLISAVEEPTMDEDYDQLLDEDDQEDQGLTMIDLMDEVAEAEQEEKSEGIIIQASKDEDKKSEDTTTNSNSASTENKKEDGLPIIIKESSGKDFHLNFLQTKQLFQSQYETRDVIFPEPITEPTTDEEKEYVEQSRLQNEKKKSKLLAEIAKEKETAQLGFLLMDSDNNGIVTQAEVSTAQIAFDMQADGFDKDEWDTVVGRYQLNAEVFDFNKISTKVGEKTLVTLPTYFSLFNAQMTFYDLDTRLYGFSAQSGSALFVNTKKPVVEKPPVIQPK